MAANMLMSALKRFMSASVGGNANGNANLSTVTTNSVTCTPTGGVAPYSYSWALQDGSQGIVITSPSAASTTFSRSGMTSGASYNDTATCTVTDNVGTVAVSNVISVNISRP